MKKHTIFILLLNILFLNSCNDKYDIDTCNIDNVIADNSQKDQMLFTRLIAVALANNSSLRELIKNSSNHTNKLYYEEVLVKDILDKKIDIGTVADLFQDIISDEGKDLQINDYNLFISGLMDNSPLLVIKIPDWLTDVDWNTDKTKPSVFSNLYVANHKIYGFKKDGDCYTKEKFFHSDGFELMVKNSEDYFLIKDKSILEYLRHPCMSIDKFVQDYCRIWNGDILVKKRDLQKLFGSCAPEYQTNTKKPNTDCPRNESDNSNFMTGFRLATPSIINTLHNDNCIAGEETFDFQVDFHYGIRTGENQLDFSKHLMIPLYGIRYAELINPDGTTRTCDIFSDFPGKALDFTYFINKNAKRWDRDKYGNNIIALWNEIDFLDCDNNKYFDKEPIQYTYGFPLEFLGKDKNPESKFNTSKFNNYEKSGIIFGQNPIPFGWNNYPYCADLKTENPTGAQALNVIFEITLN